MNPKKLKTIRKSKKSRKLSKKSRKTKKRILLEEQCFLVLIVPAQMGSKRPIRTSCLKKG